MASWLCATARPLDLFRRKSNGSQPSVFAPHRPGALELADEPIRENSRRDTKEAGIEIAIDADPVEIRRQLVLPHALLVEQRKNEHRDGDP